MLHDIERECARKVKCAMLRKDDLGVWIVYRDWMDLCAGKPWPEALYQYRIDEAEMHAAAKRGLNAYLEWKEKN